MEKTIAEMMLKEHGKINSMLAEFEKLSEINFEESKNIFIKFKWNLEKHFFVEEKVIFSIYISSSGKENDEIINLLKEHKDILWLIAKIEESLKRNNTPEIFELREMLRKHVGFENDFFYPKLDKELNERDRLLILERSEDIIRG